MNFLPPSCKAAHAGLSLVRLLGVCWLLGSGSAAFAAGNDVVVFDFGDNTASSAIYNVNGSSGSVTPVATSSGNTRIAPQAGAVSTVGDIYYFTNAGTNAGSPAPGFFRIDAATGLLSQVGSGATAGFVTGMTWDTQAGSIVYTEFGTAGGPAPGVYRLSAGGVSTVISSAAVGSGPALSNPKYPAADSAGNLYYLNLGDGQAVTVPTVVKVNPANGARTLVSGNGTGAGPAFTSPGALVGMVFDPSTGTLLVCDAGNDPASAAVLRIDLATGNRTVVTSGVSSDLPRYGGPPFNAPAFPAVTTGGRIFYSELKADKSSTTVNTLAPPASTVFSTNSGFTAHNVSAVVAVPSPLPTIAGFAPISGPVGTPVTITGSNFNGTTAVAFFRNKNATFTVVNNTTITTTVPAGATTGTIRVTTPVGSNTSGSKFTVTP